MALVATGAAISSPLCFLNYPGIFGPGAFHKFLPVSCSFSFDDGKFRNVWSRMFDTLHQENSGVDSARFSTDIY